jgi:hypothetical protein
LVCAIGRALQLTQTRLHSGNLGHCETRSSGQNVFDCVQRTIARIGGSLLPLLRRRRKATRLLQDQVNDPAPPNVRPAAPQVFEDLKVLASRLFKSVGEHAQPVGIERPLRKIALLVSRFRKSSNRTARVCYPRGAKRVRPEGVAEDFAQKAHSVALLGAGCMPQVLADIVRATTGPICRVGRVLACGLEDNPTRRDFRLVVFRFVLLAVFRRDGQRIG